MFRELGMDEMMLIEGGYYGYPEQNGNQVISDNEAKAMGAVIGVAIAKAPVVGSVVAGIAAYVAME